MLLFALTLADLTAFDIGIMFWTHSIVLKINSHFYSEKKSVYLKAFSYNVTLFLGSLEGNDLEKNADPKTVY